MKFKKYFRIITVAAIATLAAVGIIAAPVSAALGTITPLFALFGVPSQLIPVGGSVTTPAPAGGASGIVYWDVSTVVGSVAVAAGQTTMTGNFTVPPSATAGPHSITIAFPTTAESSTPISFTVNPSMAFTPPSGVVGDSLQLNGNGYPPSSVIQLYWDGAAFTTVTSTAAGVVGPVSITIPDTSRGAHIVSNTAAGSSAAAIVTVASKITLSQNSAGAGDQVTVTGTGFSVNSTISISIDGTPVTATVPSPLTTNANGHFSATITLPALSNGSHLVLAQDAGSAQASITIVPKITLSPTSGNVGDTIGITGSGFGANEVLTYKLDGNPLVVAPAGLLSTSAGVLPSGISFAIPAVAAGTHTVTVTDAEQHSSSASFTITAKLALTPGTGTVGTQIAITGSGFAPNAPVAVLWDNAAFTPAVNITASATGTISVTVTAPASAKGNHSIKASDTSGSSASATFATTSKIALSPTSGGYGDTVTVTFTGFTASSNVTEVKIYSGSTSYILVTVPASVQTDATGSASLKFTIPPVPNGTWTLQATDASNASAQSSVTVTQKLILNPTAGSAGDNVVIAGTGFKASTGIDLKYNGVTLTLSSGTVTTDANGSFQSTFSVPKTVAGSIPVTATDGTNSATANFTAAAKAAISKVTNQTTPGFVGQDITVTGTGFAANGVITVTFESAPVTVAIVSADAAGTFTATFKVPTAPSGAHTVHVSDGTTTKDFAYFMDSTAPPAPALVLPSDKFKPKQPVPFNWSAVEDPSGVSYTLQISQDPSFATVILEKTGLATPQYTMTTAEKLKSAGSKTPYYWRVKATDLAGNVSPWSTSNTFTIGFMWPAWIIYVWSGLAIIVALILGIWIGRRMAFQSY